MEIKKLKIECVVIGLAMMAMPAAAGPIAGVDFEDANETGWDRAPDDLDPDDGISVSADWALAVPGNLRNDTGANNAGASAGSFPGRLQSDGSWSITIPDTVVLNLTGITFDARGATGSAGTPSGRSGSFGTSLDGGLDGTPIWNVSDLVGRPTWTPVSVDLSAAVYQGLTDTTVTFYWNGTSAIDLDTIVLSGTTGAPGAAAFAITEIDYAAEANTVTLTWRSRPGTGYIARVSRDMTDWAADLDDSVGADRDENLEDGDLITVTFPLSGIDLEGVEALFFRIEEG